mmetsp:Transcript_98710/g.156029  ORF Transcript_98710/g.156029 Transcript_98710/m.156029 type:complete len:913 (+) Transcript_98710:127-2865(+)
MAAAIRERREVDTLDERDGEDVDIDIIGTKADAVRCETLRVSYKDPFASVDERLTEDVFLDPRDSWCNSGGGIIFVTADKLTAIQNNLDREYNYFRKVQETNDACRHDYLRELQYLMEELNAMKAQHPRSAVDIDVLLEKVEEHREAAESGKGVSEEEAETVAETVGPRVETDEALIVHLEKSGISRECELTLRILLKHMHVETDDLVAERDRLLKVLGPMDSQTAQAKVVEALLAAAQGEGATMCDLILAVQDHMKTDDMRQAIEDVVTSKLRERYDRLEDVYADLVPKVENWRATLAASEEREAKIFYLKEEKAEKQVELEEKEAFEEAKIEAWNEKNDPKKKALLLEMKAADTSTMNDEDRKNFDSMKRAEKQLEKDMAELNAAIRNCEEEAETYDAKKAKLQGLIPELRSQLKLSEETNDNAEEELQAARTRTAKATKEFDAVRHEREELEDEITAAMLPPPVNTTIFKLEEQLEEARSRNAVLREDEANIHSRERRYEELSADVQGAWKREEEELAEARRRLAEEEEQAKSTEQREGKRRLAVGDPLLLDYHERYQLEDYATNERYHNLHTDAKAKNRRLERQRQELTLMEEERIAANAASVGVFGAGHASPTKAQGHLPVWFRRPEDLRVRLAGSDITVGHVARVSTEHEELMSKLSSELQSMGAQLGRYGTETLHLHSEARSHLAAVQSGGSGSADAFALREDLHKALEEHKACLEDTEKAWQQAEHFFELCAGEAEVRAEQRSCEVRERELTVATRLLCNTCSQAAKDAPVALATPAERCVSSFQAAEPQLAVTGAARSALWPRAAEMAHRLHWERRVQDGLDSFLRDETMRRDFLDQEIKAPSGEARRALASMRAVISSGLPAGAETADIGAPLPTKTTTRTDVLKATDGSKRVGAAGIGRDA